MNFNMNLNLDKVMNALSTNKTLRIWSYIVLALIILAILVYKLADILLSIAKILEIYH